MPVNGHLRTGSHDRQVLVGLLSEGLLALRGVDPREAGAVLGPVGVEENDRVPVDQLVGESSVCGEMFDFVHDQGVLGLPRSLFCDRSAS